MRKPPVEQVSNGDNERGLLLGSKLRHGGCFLYKVGHHASHNATLKELGLEMMDALELALVPTDSAMAAKVGWGALPWPNLLTRLDEKTKGRVIRTDQSLSNEIPGIK